MTDKQKEKLTETVIWIKVQPHKNYTNAIVELFDTSIDQVHTTLLERIEKMKKRELRSPRSFGDNESTVDVSSGYNQGIEDVIALFRAELNKKE